MKCFLITLLLPSRPFLLRAAPPQKGTLVTLTAEFEVKAAVDAFPAMAEKP